MISAQTTVQKILNASETYYEIPNFQRPYSWQKGNVKDFLVDLESSVQTKRNHYFGTVVLVDETSSTYSVAIIDGQQRVTTALIMVAAIYHMVKNDPSLIADPETSPELIRDRYLFNANIDKNKVKLRTVTTDNEILQHIFDKEGDASRLSQEDKLSNLYQAYTTFRQYFADKSGLDRYINALRYFEIISITLNSSDDNPQRVFESINSTGKPLTDGDKIRNFALMLNDDDMREHVYKKYWSCIEETLVDTNKDNITDFFRSYIIAKRSAIIKLDAVYPEFKKLFYQVVDEGQSAEQLDEFYSEVLDFLDYYKLLKLTDTRHFDTQYSGIAETVFKLRYLQIDLYIPYAMNVLRYYATGSITKDDLEDVFNIIEIYFSRRIVCNINTTSVDRFLAAIHRDILSHLDSDPNNSYVEVLKYLLITRTGPTRLPSDDEFENAIRSNEIYRQKNSFIHYVLTASERGSKEIKTLRDIAEGNLKLSIEHVMPQTLTSKEWVEMLGPDYLRVHSQYLHTLANLTLTGYNSEYSNRPYNGIPTRDKMTLEVKNKRSGTTEKVGFMYSDLRINRWISSHETWDEQTLKARQKQWIKDLGRVWPMLVTTYEPVAEDTSVYLLDETDLKGTGIRSIEIFGYKLSVSTWAEALDNVAEVIYDKNPDFMDKVVKNDWLSQRINRDNTRWYNSTEILDTGIYLDTGNDTNTKLRIIHELCNMFNIGRDQIKAELNVATRAEESSMVNGI